MKVLMLGWELPPHNSGGLGVACYQLCKTLSKRNIEIEFVLPYSANHDADFMKITAASPQDIETFLKSGSVYDSFYFRFDKKKPSKAKASLSLYDQIELYEKSIENITSKKHFDIIHAHDWLTCRAAIRAKELSGKPLIIHMHSIEADRAGGPGKGNPLVREIESMALMMADKIVAVSNHTKKAITREYKIPADKIEVVHNSIDKEWYEKIDGENSFKYLEKMKSHGYRVVVNIGRITIQKGLTNLLYAAKEVVARQPKTIFLIVGNGEQERELIDLAAQLGISRNVIFTGFQRGKRLRDAFAIGDLFVMPSVSEPFGLTPLEAIGYGTPALVSRQSGVAEILNHVLKIDYWDVHKMANMITAVVQNDSLRDELHKNSAEEYSSLSWDKAADKLIVEYKRYKIAGAVV